MSEVDSKRVAILQSNYIPWKGYFDLIDSVDEFIVYDDQQYTRRDWRNRNRIKTAQGTTWLSIPVKVKGRYHQRIDETEISDVTWTERHWQTIAHAYGRAPFFDAYRDRLHALYERRTEALLSDVNRELLQGLCQILGIETAFTSSSDYDAHGAKTERLVALCRSASATTYLSGPSARAYMDESLFHDVGIEVQYMDYGGYPEYDQLYPPFEHEVSILDLVVHTGTEARRFLKSAPAPS